MLLCECDNKTVKVPSPDDTVTLQSLIAQNCDKSHSFALRHKDMFFVSMANFVMEFNNEGVFLYDIGTGVGGGEAGKLDCPTGLAVDKYDSVIVGLSRICSSSKKVVNSIRGTGPSTSKPFSCCCIKR